jgi:CheY-like chemotaxis protein
MSLASSSDYTIPSIIPARASDWLFVSGLSNSIMAGSGSNPNSERVQPSASPSRCDDSFTGAGFQILVIEDNSGDVYMVREVIKAAGLKAEICVVTDGEQATRFFDERDLDSSKPCPDAIILDINLPKKSGGEILRHIRRSVRCYATPVLIVSTSGSEKDRADVMNHGANAYFHKPSEYDEYLKLGPILRGLLPGEARL